MRTALSRTQPQDSRDEILKAAIRLFEKSGFHETSMSEVAKEAHVSKALIFWHFKTKEELFIAALTRLLEPYYIDFAEESRQLEAREQLEKLIEFYLLFVRDNAPSVKFFLTRLFRDDDVSGSFTVQIRALYEGYRSLLIELIAKAQESGAVTKVGAPEGVARLLMLALNGLLVELLFMRKDEFNLAGALAIIRDLLFQPAVPRGESEPLFLTPSVTAVKENN